MGGGEVVADGADAAHASGDALGFFYGTVLHKHLEAAYVHNVEVGIGDVALLVELNGNGSVSLDAGDGSDFNSFSFLTHAFTPFFVFTTFV